MTQYNFKDQQIEVVNNENYTYLKLNNQLIHTIESGEPPTEEMLKNAKRLFKYDIQQSIKYLNNNHTLPNSTLGLFAWHMEVAKCYFSLIFHCLISIEEKQQEGEGATWN